MSPVEITLVVACALLLVAVAGTALALRQLVRRTAALETSIDGLREQVEELTRRESAREAAEEARSAEQADWVITFDDRQQTRNGSRRRAAAGQEPAHVAPTHRVVSTTLGEPLIKVAAFSHGVRQALREEKRAHLAYQVRREYRRRRRESRARARAAQRSARRTARSTTQATAQERAAQ